MNLEHVAPHVGDALLALHRAQDATEDDALRADLERLVERLQDYAERIGRQTRGNLATTRWW